MTFQLMDMSAPVQMTSSVTYLQPHRSLAHQLWDCRLQLLELPGLPGALKLICLPGSERSWDFFPRAWLPVSCLIPGPDEVFSHSCPTPVRLVPDSLHRIGRTSETAQENRKPGSQDPPSEGCSVLSQGVGKNLSSQTGLRGDNNLSGQPRSVNNYYSTH